MANATYAACDRSGERFGKLTVRRPYGRDAKGHIIWLCDCDCGSSRAVYGGDIGRIKSCGKCAPYKERREPIEPKGQPCWHCKNYIDGCSWSRKEHKPVEGWIAEKSVKYQGDSSPLETYAILYCPEFVSDGTEGRDE